MVATTLLHAEEMDQPTGNSELDELLAEAKRVTDMNYQLVWQRTMVVKERRFLPNKVEWGRKLSLYLHVGGMPPWQVFSCVSTEQEAFAYLFGLLTGYDQKTRQVESSDE